ncbi:MAG: DUF4962 domain-containing protein [Armatimonadota bacterium]
MDIRCFVPGALCLLFILSTILEGSAAEFELRRPFHPRLKTTPDELQTTRADDAEVERARSLGEAELAREKTGSYEDYWIPLPEAPFPESHAGDTWPYWTGLTGHVRRYLERLTYAYAVTGEQRFYDACYTALMSVCDWPQWTDPDYSNGEFPCLDTHSLIRGVTTAYDFLYNDLSEADRQRVAEAIVNKGCERVYPYANQEGIWVSQPNSWPNGYAVVHTGMGVGALAVMGDVEGVEKYLGTAIEKMNDYFDQQGGEDGGLIEGFGYGSVAVDNFMYLIETANAVTGVDLLTHPYLEQAIHFPAYFVLPGGGSVANFGDNGGPTGCSPTLTNLARALVQVRGNTLAAWYLVQAGDADGETEKLAKVPDALPLARRFRSIRWAALRSGWGPHDALLAFKSGFVKNHNHLDQNHFILGWSTQWVINDPGYQIYNRPYPDERNMTMEEIKNRHQYTFGTEGHNSILVDGTGQLKNPGEVGALYSTPAMGYTTGDATACYDDRLSRFVRHVISVPDEYYLIFDDVAARDTARSIDILLHTPPDGAFFVDGTELAEDTAVPATGFDIRRDRAQVHVDVLGPQALQMTHRIWPDSAQYGHYVSLTTGDKHEEFTNCLALQAGPPGRELQPLTGQVEATDEGYSIELNAPGGQDVFLVGPGDHGPVRSDGEMAMASVENLTRYALCQGTSLTCGDRPLVTATDSVTVGARLRGGLFRAVIEASQEASVTIQAPEDLTLIRVIGLDQPVDVSYNDEDGLMTISVPPGRYTLQARKL